MSRPPGQGPGIRAHTDVECIETAHSQASTGQPVKVLRFVSALRGQEQKCSGNPCPLLHPSFSLRERRRQGRERKT